MFGNTIEGNGARKLMENADAIIQEMEQHVLQATTRFAGTDEQICHVGSAHWHLLHSLDGYFLLLRTKRFHLTPAILQKGKEFCDQILALERYLGMSVTTKSHLMEDHSLEQQEELHGFGNLGEDFGEQNHLDQAKCNIRLGCVRNFAAREKFKSLEEVQAKDTKVQAKILYIRVKRSRSHYEGTEARQVAKRQRQLDAREEVLALPSPVGRMTTLSERRVLKLNDA
jgi:hypothetical protein